MTIPDPTYYDDDYLAHYGVLGMKWGVRKDGRPQGYQGGSRKESRQAKRANKQEYKQATKNLKQVRKVSNKNLRSRNRNKAIATERANKHINSLIKAAQEDPTSLIEITRSDNIKQLVAGKEFVDNIIKTGVVDADARIWTSSKPDSYDNRYHRRAYDKQDSDRIVAAKKRVEAAKTKYKNS